MRKTALPAAALIAGLITTTASAQVTPSDVRDLVGARAAGAESDWRREAM